MDFNIFSRVRKTKPSSTTPTGSSVVATTPPQPTSNMISTVHTTTPVPLSPGKGLKKIATSRKIITQPAKRQVCQTTSNESQSSTGSSAMAAGTSASDRNDLRTGYKTHEYMTKANAVRLGTAIDSGVESGKTRVCQQDSNTSTGSVMSGHINMASELERRCQMAAKLAFKEENKEHREKENRRQERGKSNKPADREKQQDELEVPEDLTIRRTAMDMDSLEKKQTQYAKKKTKKKKKHRLKSDQSHARINVDKIMKRTSSSNCASDGALSYDHHGNDDADDITGINSDDDQCPIVIHVSTRQHCPPHNQPHSNQPPAVVIAATTSSGEESHYSDDAFADDEHDEDNCRRKAQRNASHDGESTTESSSEEATSATSGSEFDSAQGTYTGGNTSETSEEKVKMTATKPTADAGGSKAVKDTSAQEDMKVTVETVQAPVKSDQTHRRKSSNSQQTSNRRASNQKTTVVDVAAPKLVAKAPPVVSVASKSENIFTKRSHLSAIPTNFPSPNTSTKVQPTSRRVNGVTLRDLYSLRAVLSDSDNGTVFSGRRRIDNAAVAIKRIMKSKVKRWNLIKDKSVPMEIALLRKVNEQRHPGVVTLLEWFECSDCFLLVMARPTPVLDLFDFVSERKRLDERSSRIIFVQVIQSMFHCHNYKVLHRDIKLENILVKTDTLITTLIDFGCGTLLDDNLYKDFAGTPQYYPPEYYICKQYHGLPAAVWSIGVMLYAMLCGRLPFASAHEIVHLEPSWHGSFCRKISPAAKDLVECMLKKQPRRRLQMNDVLRHRWLKDIKYNPQTGEVTFLVEPGEDKTAQVQAIKNLNQSHANSSIAAYLDSTSYSIQQATNV